MCHLAERKDPSGIPLRDAKYDDNGPRRRRRFGSYFDLSGLQLGGWRSWRCNLDILTRTESRDWLGLLTISSISFVRVEPVIGQFPVSLLCFFFDHSGGSLLLF